MNENIQDAIQRPRYRSLEHSLYDLFAHVSFTQRMETSGNTLRF